MVGIWYLGIGYLIFGSEWYVMNILYLFVGIWYLIFGSMRLVVGIRQCIVCIDP